MPKPSPEAQTARLQTRRLLLDGHVQGVGFRPFVYRLAQRLGVAGEVRNIAGRVEIVAIATAGVLDTLEHELIASAPAIARPRVVAVEVLPARDCRGFGIAPSADVGERDIHVPPDYFTCDDCLRELDDPTDRRHAYPFINCTQCGPRYTLIAALPYDRANTSMAPFTLCDACRAEYADPCDRRFHAEPVACPTCGPWLTFHADGTHSTHADALAHAVQRLRDGAIVAIKGVGGYHLACDAADESAVVRLRARKHRPHKPLAVMFPAPCERPLAMLERYLDPGEPHRAALLSTRRPIVLCPRRATASADAPLLAPAIAPGIDEIGAMLPYSPLHHLLLNTFGGPLVMTSGNLSGEPVLTEAHDAEMRLAPVADAFLHHNRPILRPADDSVYRVVAGAPSPLRIGRGVAPLELSLPEALSDALPEPVLAVGGHMKNTVALGWGRRLVLSPHIGDLDSPRALEVFAQVCADLQDLYGVRASRVLCDAHPGYASHRWARQSGLSCTPVQHHRAHASALVLDGLADDAIAFAWDGTGYGDDGSLWGGETFVGRPGHWRRFASLRPFRLPGGDRAGREPWRSAAAACWEAGTPFDPPVDDGGLTRQAWSKDVNAPRSHAAGSLFDAAAALTGTCEIASFEGQGPMWLEASCSESVAAPALPLRHDADGLLLADWAPLLRVVGNASRDRGERAAWFHETMAQTLLALAAAARDATGYRRVGLTGGVFQNRRLVERVYELLAAAGFDCVIGRAVPVNDGGISAGQIIEYAAGRDT